jgi:hypothetical protein
MKKIFGRSFGQDQEESPDAGPLDSPDTSLRKALVGSNATSGLALLQEVVASWRDPGVITGHDPANSFGTPLVCDTVLTQSVVLLLCRLCNLIDGLEESAGQQLTSYLAHTQGEVH